MKILKRRMQNDTHTDSLNRNYLYAVSKGILFGLQLYIICGRYKHHIFTTTKNIKNDAKHLNFMVFHIL